MKQASTVLLRLSILGIGAIILAICIVPFFLGFTPDKAGIYWPILIVLYTLGIPVFIALYQSMKLLSYIDKGTAFSGHSVKSLNIIKYCAIVVTCVFVAGSPFIVIAAEADDAPGVIVIAMVIAGASFIIATFAALLKKLLNDAIQLKSENDLTV